MTSRDRQSSSPTPSVTVAGLDLDALEKVARDTLNARKQFEDRGFTFEEPVSRYDTAFTVETVLKLIASARASRPTPSAKSTENDQ